MIRAWNPRSSSDELQLCQRYCQAIAPRTVVDSIGFAMLLSGGGAISTALYLPVEMRTRPTFTHNVTTWAAGAPVGAQAAWFNYAASAWATGTLSSVDSDAGNYKTGGGLRFLPTTTFSGTGGNVGISFFGPAVIAYYNAEL